MIGFIKTCVKKLVVLTGQRQVGKSTLSRQLVDEFAGAQFLNYDVAAHRAVMMAQSWRQSAPLLVFDEIYKMRNWKTWLKGVVDGHPPGQQLLVTGSARMDTFRQSGESLAGRYFRLRLHPLSVREWSEQALVSPHAALTHLLERGGFPEPALADTHHDAQRWRNDYFAGLVPEAEVDFCLSEGDTLTHLVEGKLCDCNPHRALMRFADQWPQAQAIQLLRECRAEADVGRLQIRDAAP
jgi:predicted AAA+ superfamily ATPase